MYNVSDLLGKPLINIVSANTLGTIANIYFDEKCQKGTFVKLYTQEDECKFFPFPKMDISGDAAVTACDELLDEAEGIKCPINSFAFNQNGKLLGKVVDVVMDGTKVAHISLSDVDLPVSKLLSAGEVLIFNDTGKSIRLKPVKRPQKPAPAPKKFAPSYDFLLGKKLQRTITASDGKVIARAGENITRDTISLAKSEGKLVILALNSL